MGYQNNEENIKRYRETKDIHLRNQIIEDNMKLVKTIAADYATRTKEKKRYLESYGYEGLILAVDEFDPERGCKFSTYATNKIKWMILKGLAEMRGLEGVNFYPHYIKSKIKIENQYEMKLEEHPELISLVIDDLIEKQAMGQGYVEEQRRRILLSMPLSYEELDEDAMIDDYSLSYEICMPILWETLNMLLEKKLTPKEKDVIIKSFGLGRDQMVSLPALADEYHVTRERIRQIRDKALRKLRHPVPVQLLSGYLECFNQYEKPNEFQKRKKSI